MLHMNRRTFIASTSTALGGLFAGGMLFSSTESAAAEVSLGDLQIGDDKTTTDDGVISNVSCTVSGNWKYRIPGGNPTTWNVQLRASNGDTWASVAKTSNSLDGYHQMSGDYSLSGSLTDTDAFGLGMFEAPGPGKQKSVTLPLQVWFQVLDDNQTALASTKVADEATVTVAQSEIDASLHGQVSGSGSLSVTD